MSLLWITCYLIFFFKDPATTEIYTLSLHDALPILAQRGLRELRRLAVGRARRRRRGVHGDGEGRLPGAAPAQDRLALRSEEHTSELQSQSNLVCRLLLEKKKERNINKHVSFTTSSS